MGLFDRLARLGVDLGDGLLSQAESFAKAAKNPADESADGGSTTGKDQDPVVEPTTDDPEALFWDPFAIIEQLGYKEKPSRITYGTLEAMVWKIPLIQGILMTRIAQISSFARPQRDIFQTGFRVKLREADAKPTAVDRKFLRQMEEMMLTTGVSQNPLGRDSFEAFLRKTTRDSMTFDQMCFEMVKNRKGEPAQFFAVDASTIRLADTPKTFWDENDRYAVRTVQVYKDMVINEWDHESMAFCVRNPTTSIRNFGYGTSEMEMLVQAITSYLWAFDYNSRFFSQGSVAKGLLNIKGAINQKQLRAFRRQWYQMISGIENAWRSPVLNAEEVQWLNMQQSNRDMEFSAFMDFLIKVICAVYLVDPIEVNFKYGNSGQQRTAFEGANKQKLVESKDKGLKPLLRFIARNITNYVIRPINPDFELEFVGLEAQTHEDLAKINAQRVKTTHTINELRAEYDLPADPYGDVILDPVYVQFRQGQEMQEQGALPNGQMPGEEGGGDEDFGEDSFNFEDDDDETDDEGNGNGGDTGGRDGEPAKPQEAQKSLVPPPGTILLDLNF